jgi:hypothetical protein
MDSRTSLGRIVVRSFRVVPWLNVSAFGCVACALGAVLGTGSIARGQNTQKAAATTRANEVEEIYIARSVPESFDAPTAFCTHERIGFKSPNIEGQYTFRSTATRSSDGRMVDTNANTVGSMHVCSGPTSDPTIINLYGEGLLGSTSFKGSGKCHLRRDLPEEGLISERCFLNLSGLPSQFVGGLLTTNTMLSRNRVGMETDPPGYTQSSIATIRLWKRRTERQAPQ